MDEHSLLSLLQLARLSALIRRYFATDLKATLIRGASGTFALQITLLGMGFVIRYMLAHTLSTADLGLYNYALAWSEILVQISVLGFDQVLVRELAGAYAQSQWGVMRGLLQFANRLTLFTALTIMIAAAVIVWLSASAHEIDLTAVKGVTLLYQVGQTTIAVMLIGLLLIPLKTSIRIRQGAMRGFYQIIRSSVPENLLQPVVYLGMIGACVLLLRERFSPVIAILLYLLSYSAAYLYGNLLQAKATPAEVGKANSDLRLRDWLASAFPLMVLSGIQIINRRVDYIMVGLLDSTANLAIYSMADQLVQLVVLVLLASNVVLAPTFARLYRLGDMDKLQRIVTRSSRVILLVSGLAAMGLVLTGEFLLGVFGQEFKAGHTALAILAIGQLVNAGTGSVGVLMVMTGNTWYTSVAVAIAAATNAALNALLIPRFGINGSAVADAISTATVNIVLAYFVWKKLKIVPSVLGSARRSHA